MIRRAARLAARLLPSAVKGPIARRRFGHAGGEGRAHFSVARRQTGEITEYTIDDGVTFSAGASDRDPVEYTFIKDPDSRAEIAGFIRTSRALAPGALLFDIGAHVGVFSIVHLALHPQHRAVLFEASPPLSRISEAWLRLNGFEGRADARAVGVGDVVGDRPIALGAFEFAEQLGPERTAQLVVPFTTIDHVCRTEQLSPAILKIDVEGHEAEVLRGARETLRTKRPHVFIELHLDVLEQRHESIAGVVAEFASLGYTFETTEGRPLARRRVEHSLKAILRIVARPGARS